MGCPLAEGDTEKQYLEELDKCYYNIIYFWKGAITIEWLEKQSPKKILSIIKNQNRIAKEQE